VIPTTIHRRRFLGLCAGLAATPALGQPERATPDHITPEAQRAIDRGLAWLARAQDSNGSFGGGSPILQGNVAITALAGMAFLAGGHQPDRGQYGSQVTKALQYILTQEDRNTPGFLYHPVPSSHGPMYSHGFGTMFLGEAYGQIPDAALSKRVRTTLEKAVQLILACQNHEGGWRYRPIREQADVSVTICQMMALRSARNAGLSVPKSAADKCIEYVRACQTLDGGFRYYRQSGGSAFPRSAAGLCAFYSAGLYQGKEIDRALNYLMKFKPTDSRGFRQDTHYYYGHYYAAQAFWTAGEPHWSNWFPAVRDDLLKPGRQRPDGAWIDNNFQSEYATAMALIILQIPNNYLPILQK
jgi:hypothetical protein